jgi:hypothetical protein
MAHRSLEKDLNNIAYAHVNKYAKALGIQARAQANANKAAAAAAATPTAENKNKARQAAAAAAAAANETKQVGIQTSNVIGAIGNLPVNTPNSSRAAANVEAKVTALVARIMRGNFSSENGKLNNSKLNNNYRSLKNSQRVKNAMASKYTPAGNGVSPPP